MIALPNGDQQSKSKLNIDSQGNPNNNPDSYDSDSDNYSNIYDGNQEGENLLENDDFDYFVTFIEDPSLPNDNVDKNDYAENENNNYDENDDDSRYFSLDPILTKNKVKIIFKVEDEVSKRGFKTIIHFILNQYGTFLTKKDTRKMEVTNRNIPFNEFVQKN